MIGSCAVPKGIHPVACSSADSGAGSSCRYAHPAGKDPKLYTTVRPETSDSVENATLACVQRAQHSGVLPRCLVIKITRGHLTQSTGVFLHRNRDIKWARRTWRRPEPQASASRDMEKTGAPATFNRIAPSMQPTHTSGPPSGQASGSCAVPCRAAPQNGRQPADLTPWTTPLRLEGIQAWAGMAGLVLMRTESWRN